MLPNTLEVDSSPLWSGCYPGGRYWEGSSVSDTEKIAGYIRDFDAQGWHRTGSVVDVTSAQWLAAEVQALGLEADLEPVALSRIDPQACFIEAEGRQVAGLPLFDGGFTGLDGVSGRVGPLDSEAEIGVVEGSTSELSDAFDAERESHRHQAYVAVTRGTRQGLAVRNAPRFLSPFGPPVLQVGSEEREWIAQLSQRGYQARLMVSIVRNQAESYNVVGRLSGQDPKLRPLVVTTPRNGWWHCAAERGGGIACWLHAMRILSEERRPRDVLFVATTGHELGLLGIQSLVDRRPNIVGKCASWVHFGASIGAAHAPRLSLAASDVGLEEAAFGAIAEHGAGPVLLSPRGSMVGAESTFVFRRGARCVALAGEHATFHMEADRWPDAVDVEAVSSYASAFADLAVRLASGPGENLLPRDFRINRVGATQRSAHPTR